MRLFSAFLTVGLALPAIAAAAPPMRGAGLRTVQLITATASNQERQSVDQPTESATPESAPAIAASFVVHDLSRQWVEFQMARSLQATAAPSADVDDGEDPFAHVGVAQPDVGAFAGGPAVLPPTQVPAWMRGGSATVGGYPRFAPGCGGASYRPSGFLSRNDEVRRQAYFGLMSNIACEYGIPVGLFDAMIIRESRYNPAAVSAKSAFGLTQLMPATAAGLGVNRYSIDENLRGGAKYLRQQLDRFGQYHLALAAYNAGPQRIRDGRVPPIAETRAYVSSILSDWTRLVSGGRSPDRLATPDHRRVAIVSSF